ncbi:MAG: hypothetical protein DMF88_21415 [Acidobacteria bacterium]|nr:MAG: hypothetical protein DMF88_21415 [Acidobacteriota bacterium]
MSEFVEELHQDPEDVEEELAKKEFGLLMYRLQKLSPRARARLQSDFAQRMVETTLPIETPKGKLSFVLLGKTSAGRAMSLLTKQPATIEWIDGFQPGSVFWDVGASIGVFSLYAALGTDTKVIAFEPAAVNYYLLSANCEANSLLDQIDCLLVGLGSEPAIARLALDRRNHFGRCMVVAAQPDVDREFHWFQFRRGKGLGGRGNGAVVAIFERPSRRTLANRSGTLRLVTGMAKLTSYRNAATVEC